MSFIVGTPEFNKNLDDWLFKNEKKYAQYFAKNKAKIPPMFRSTTSTLYRGMVVDMDFMQALHDTGKFVFKEQTSWTKERKVAVDFVKSSKYKTTNKQGLAIIISKKIPASQQILDINAYVLFMGVAPLAMQGIDEMSLDSAVKEQEVLIDKGVGIVSKDVEILK